MVWTELETALYKVIEEFTNHAKRATKKVKIPETKENIVIGLVNSYNTYIKLSSKESVVLTVDQKQEIIEKFYYLRDRLIYAFAQLDIICRIPIESNELLDLDSILEKLSCSKPKTMASFVDFVNLADKILPKQFDGNTSGLDSFVDALELLAKNCTGNEENAIAIVKTRLQGKARLALNDTEKTIGEIITALKSKCITVSSNVIEAKLASIKQNGSDAATFIKQIEDISDILLKTYLAEGVRKDTAEKFVKNKVVKSLTKNARSDRVRLVIEAGSFATVDDALAKFLSTDNESNNNHIMYYKAGHGSRGHQFTCGNLLHSL